jgi:glycerate kinase
VSETRLVVVAPDSFKGSLSAVQAALAMERGVLEAWPDSRVVKIPIADGGEGTVEALVTATCGRYQTCTVRGPLGRPVEARWGVLGDGMTAVVEMAAASGLTLVPEGRRDPRIASTFGTGQLIRAVLDAGFRHLVIGIGGSATNDGGSGMAKALGVRLLDGRGDTLPEGGAALSRLASVDLSRVDPRLAGTEILVACDVDNPLTGPRGASAVYGPQKGATPAVVAELDAALERYAAVSSQATGRDVAGLPGAGAAGGLGAGLLLFTPARLIPGIDLVLDSTRFDDQVRGASLVVVGEGRTDHQTAMGKAPVGVARVASRHGVPVLLVSGSLGPGAEEVLTHGIGRIVQASPPEMPLQEAMARAAELLQAAVAASLRVPSTPSTRGAP